MTRREEGEKRGGNGEGQKEGEEEEEEEEEGRMMRLNDETGRLHFSKRPADDLEGGEWRRMADGTEKFYSKDHL